MKSQVEKILKINIEISVSIRIFPIFFDSGYANRYLFINFFVFFFVYNAKSELPEWRRVQEYTHRLRTRSIFADEKRYDGFNHEHTGVYDHNIFF